MDSFTTFDFGFSETEAVDLEAILSGARAPMDGFYDSGVPINEDSRQPPGTWCTIA